ncbi:MAG: trypsin-like peptidase domain-containing protein [Candidatus Omnitrophica bacterium]|nr:trypsin-like peptidase domain-containing protein [Candidatus Omnitrophota bacterium]
MSDILRGRKAALFIVAAAIMVATLFVFSKEKAPGVRVVGEVDLKDAFINVADQVGPAVVSISTERTHKIKVNMPSLGGMSPFHEEFFRDFFKGMPEEYEKKQMGLGSGVIIDKEGYILTNEHVVSGADKILVTLSDGRKFEGKLKGSDPKSDLATIKISAKNLPVAEFGNSDYVKTGEWVVAIGNPFGYIVDSPKPTVTAGVISALHRSLPSNKSGYMDLIQTDAAINPGNSGGPLCDIEGKVIGINVAIFSTTGGYQGVGFAIPANQAKKVMGDLIKGKKISYGWMGVVVQEITEDLAAYFKLQDQKGVLVAQVIKDGPAYNAGIKEGDVIKRFDKKSVDSVKELLFKINSVAVGKDIEVELIHGGEKVVLKMLIGEMPSDKELARMQGKFVEEDEELTEKWRGIEVSPITDKLALGLNIVNREGVVVISVEQASAAYHANIRVGDVIKKIGAKVVKDIEDYKDAIGGLEGDVLLYTDRGFAIVKKEQ